MSGWVAFIEITQGVCLILLGCSVAVLAREQKHLSGLIRLLRRRHGLPDPGTREIRP